jgi:Tfp pilus assembly protein PilX
MNLNTRITKYAQRKGYVLGLVVVVMAILIILTTGEMMSSYQSRIQAVNAKAQTEAMLAAEAGYEKAIFWMSQQPDILGSLQNGGGSGNLNFGSSSCRYQVGFLDYMGARPLFKVAAIGTSGGPVFGRSVDVAVIQEVTGWAMGVCEIPSSSKSTDNVYFVDGEVIDIPVHINNHKDSPDNIDIHISGSPRFKRKVEMGESRKTSVGIDKYSSAMTYFQGGISFNQPYIRITDSTAVTSKLNRFRDSTKSAYRFTPNGTANVPSANKHSAIQLELFVQNGVGKVRITNNCTVLGFQQNNDNRTNDFMITPGGHPQPYQRYDIYAYHFRPPSITDPTHTYNISDTYVTQQFGGAQSEPGGQIYVNGNVVIGSDTYTNMVVNGKLTVVATGNIWIADSIVVDGTHDANGLPTTDNPNVFGLIAQGIIKVVDPGISGYATGNPNNYPGPAPVYVNDFSHPTTQYRHYYQPIGNGTLNSNNRTLPDPMVIEAALTIGGGGWGAENVTEQQGSNWYGGRKEFSIPTDNLIVRGSISEAIRGIVGISGSVSDGYVKKYYMDNRLTQGILPGDIWFSGKYIPAPDGWQDYRTGTN